MSTAKRTIFIAPKCTARRRIAPKCATRSRIAPKITARRRTLIAGTGDIIARCREWGLPDPQWQIEDGDDFVMVMPRPKSSVKSVDWTVDWSVCRFNQRRILGRGEIKAVEENPYGY